MKSFKNLLDGERILDGDLIDDSLGDSEDSAIVI